MKNDFRRENMIFERKTAAFGGNTALYEYNFQHDSGRVKQMKEIRSYADQWPEMQRNNLGLLLWGRPGNGKTFAAACIANALCEQMKDVRMLTLGAMLNKLPGMTPQDKDCYMSSLEKCDLLIVDDFGMERRTDYAQEQVYALINGRYLVRKPLIVTTNLSITELKSSEDMTQKRIYDRVLEMCVPVYFDGDSLRQERAMERIEVYKKLTR